MENLGTGRAARCTRKQFGGSRPGIAFKQRSGSASKQDNEKENDNDEVPQAVNTKRPLNAQVLTIIFIQQDMKENWRIKHTLL